ncbi:MAG: hypothetical protein EAZ78_08075 [Oscillatoriales cyanobacterium]|uniref:Plastid lipid-associated protein/fibrillin conserved domain-containing protein n=1 Tax=Microcoleus anatoxicus PTRS2 TaxID=2705321 RepID=A0ABU8YSW9_9CYAN|nr:MAG: hypothetical protein EA000_14120 [Oscillatoriales cyanobacterium]TAD93763.1 MAG: hypothetical protein EAZ98_21615 [Oscillatoriales cyanobacterium]TAE03408.1 MAG: hypothetical protein EAZ96_12905 [Oscillatoriales cyanobacterium]TAF04636.1 MAG: hypothetical protein EAZ78_08075 [Oscillatoriales cyanobacterium]TAF46087.1 MAG: hypothetical protein EAZ68_04235 [Oscillatoriales cyanobacterium]
MEHISILEQAAKSNSKPSSSAVVTALLAAEKNSKKTKPRYTFHQLIGHWQLCFITGTKKTRQKAGIVLGAGKYIPQWIAKIQIAYSAAPVAQGEDNSEIGRVENSVKVGTMELTLSGPTKFLPNNILAFDFTRIMVKLLGKTVYQGYIRGGEAREAEFLSLSVGKQAFFAYFLVEDGIIAARGRGGGLALWGRV